MKLVILRSVDGDSGEKAENRYTQRFNTRFAERVLGNLRGNDGFCTACGPDCNSCRKRYGRRFDSRTVSVVGFPAVLPYVLETPADHVPRNVQANDVLLAINIHEQILIEILKVCRGWGTRAVVVPLEAPGWVCGATRATAHMICEKEGIEIAFPKPFCSFNPPAGSVLAEFREHFHIGFPDVRLTVENGTITDALVAVSAACGATYCVARWLPGRSLDDNIEIEVISKRWHSYPCTASMERDPELNGETPLHVAGQAHYSMLVPHKDRVSGLESEFVSSPLGRIVQRPIPPRENLQNIENAKALILNELRERPAVNIARLRNQRHISPAAINSALIILRQEGKITTKGPEILRSSGVSGQ